MHVQDARTLNSQQTASTLKRQIPERKQHYNYTFQINHFKIFNVIQTLIFKQLYGRYLIKKKKKPQKTLSKQ